MHDKSLHLGVLFNVNEYSGKIQSLVRSVGRAGVQVLLQIKIESLVSGLIETISDI